MDFDQAIAAHSSWKQKLRKYIANPDRSLLADDVEMDNRCDLGKWIAAEKMNYGSLPELEKLRSEHVRFHLAAAAIIRRADSGQNVTEEVALGSKSDYSYASSAVVRAIMAFKSKVEKPDLATK